jgi:hypothetical protein
MAKLLLSSQVILQHRFCTKLKITQLYVLQTCCTKLHTHRLRNMEGTKQINLRSSVKQGYL